MHKHKGSEDRTSDPSFIGPPSHAAAGMYVVSCIWVHFIHFSLLWIWIVLSFPPPQRSKKKKKNVISSIFLRFLSLCVITGLRLLHVSDSSLDRHLLKTPSQPHPAVLRMGTSHHCHAHQQVCVCFCMWVCVVLIEVRTGTLCLCLSVSALLDDSSSKHSTQACTPPVPLSLTPFLYKSNKKGLSHSLILHCQHSV